MEFLGTVDEQQSLLGLIEDSPEIQEIQYDLYEIMANRTVDVERIDGYISNYTMPNINSFILPRGIIHVIRCVARRAERRAVSAGMTEAIPYLNRLSDYLYILTFNK